MKVIEECSLESGSVSTVRKSVDVSEEKRPAELVDQQIEEQKE